MQDGWGPTSMKWGRRRPAYCLITPVTIWERLIKQVSRSEAAIISFPFIKLLLALDNFCPHHFTGVTHTHYSLACPDMICGDHNIWPGWGAITTTTQGITSQRKRCKSAKGFFVWFHRQEEIFVSSVYWLFVDIQGGMCGMLCWRS